MQSEELTSGSSGSACFNTLFFVSHEHPMSRAVIASGTSKRIAALPQQSNPQRLGQTACSLAPSGLKQYASTTRCVKKVDCGFKWVFCHKKTMPMEQHAASSVLSTPERFKHFTFACVGVCPACSQHLVQTS